jgi:predicted XRE-type DNA-binding protein
MMARKTRQRFENVWDALERTPGAAMRMTIRSKLIIAIEQKVRVWRVTRPAAARRLGITQSRLNDLFRGRINKFDIETLVGLATKADLKVRMRVISR